jgi:sulfite reductase (NADPH) flavoprotein alpha-component
MPGRRPPPMLRKILFQVHWFFGITAGVVLGIVGITGGLLSFEEELLHALNRDVMQVVPQSADALSPGKLLDALQTANPGRRIAALGISGEPGAAVRVTFERGAGAGAATERGRRGDVRYADPYNGTLLGAATRGEKFFQTARQVHRYLAAGEVGKQIVGASTLALIFFCASGLYLRWPAKTLDWRAWLKPNFRASGRQFLWQLHAMFATWALLFYLVAGLTGLYWSYDWYREALVSWSGAPRPSPPGNRAREGDEPETRAQTLDSGILDESWRVFMRESGGFSSAANVNLPSRPGQPIEIRYLSIDPPHDRAFNNLRIDANTGTVLRHDRFAARKPAARLVGSIFPLHSGSFFGATGKALMMIASFAMPLFTITGWLMYLKRRARKRQAASAVAFETPG